MLAYEEEVQEFICIASVDLKDIGLLTELSDSPHLKNQKWDVVVLDNQDKFHIGKLEKIITHKDGIPTRDLVVRASLSGYSFDERGLLCYCEKETGRLLFMFGDGRTAIQYDYRTDQASEVFRELGMYNYHNGHRLRYNSTAEQILRDHEIMELRVMPIIYQKICQKTESEQEGDKDARK